MFYNEVIAQKERGIHSATQPQCNAVRIACGITQRGILAESSGSLFAENGVEAEELFAGELALVELEK